jgi:ZIP family zinc transporter
MGPEIEGNVMLAFGLTLFAGLATGIGSLVVFFSRKLDMSLLSFGLGLSSGVMVYISLVEMLPEAAHLMAEHYGESGGGWLATGCFFGGVAICALIDKLVPDPENPHELSSIEQMRSVQEEASASVPESVNGRATSLARLGPLTALVIGLHNFPEGIATFASSLADASLGLSIAFAVAIHNIPEGVSVAIPTFFATGSRRKAMFHSFASGLAEPIGALLAYLVLMSFLNDLVIAAMLSAVGGIMVFISFDELLPAAREYEKGHTAITGVVIGMAVMAVSLLIL